MFPALTSRTVSRILILGNFRRAIFEVDVLLWLKIVALDMGALGLVETRTLLAAPGSIRCAKPVF